MGLQWGNAEAIGAPLGLPEARWGSLGLRRSFKKFFKSSPTHAPSGAPCGFLKFPGATLLGKCVVNLTPLGFPGAL